MKETERLELGDKVKNIPSTTIYCAYCRKPMVTVQVTHEGKGLMTDLTANCCKNKITLLKGKTLLAHEAHAKEMMKETSQTPILWNYWRGRYDEARSYKEVQSPKAVSSPCKGQPAEKELSLPPSEHKVSTPQVSKSQKGEVKK